MNKELSNLVTQLAQQLIQKKLHITTAESCTGGGIAAALTSIAGSSDWFEFGVVSYANRAKIKLLGVTETTLEAEGAVSEAVVKQMAKGALALSDADIAVAVSGIAGPGGGSVEKPVGTVWFCWQHSGGKTITDCFHFASNREIIREQAVLEGVKGLLQILR